MSTTTTGNSDDSHCNEPTRSQYERLQQLILNDPDHSEILPAEHDLLRNLSIDRNRDLRISLAFFEGLVARVIRRNYRGCFLPVGQGDLAEETHYKVARRVDQLSPEQQQRIVVYSQRACRNNLCDALHSKKFHDPMDPHGIIEGEAAEPGSGRRGRVQASHRLVLRSQEQRQAIGSTTHELTPKQWLFWDRFNTKTRDHLDRLPFPLNPRSRVNNYNAIFLYWHRYKVVHFLLNQLRFPEKIYGVPIAEALVQIPPWTDEELRWTFGRPDNRDLPTLDQLWERLVDVLQQSDRGATSRQILTSAFEPFDGLIKGRFAKKIPGLVCQARNLAKDHLDDEAWRLCFAPWFDQGKRYAIRDKSNP